MARIIPDSMPNPFIIDPVVSMAATETVVAPEHETTDAATSEIVAARTDVLQTVARTVSRGGESLNGEMMNKKHGYTGSPTYCSWRDMKQRCLNHRNKDYRNYGGRGITVCECWINSFSNFLEDMGECPADLTLDRKNNDGDYTKQNCRWATREQQHDNQRNNSAALKGREHSPEHNAKVSAGLTAAHARHPVWIKQERDTTASVRDDTDCIYEIFAGHAKERDHRFILDEEAFMIDIEALPMFLSRTG